MPLNISNNLLGTECELFCGHKGTTGKDRNIKPETEMYQKNKADLIQHTCTRGDETSGGLQPTIYLVSTSKCILLILLTGNTKKLSAYHWV